MRVSQALGDLSRVSVSLFDHVLHQELEGEMVLLDLQSGGYYGLNEVGSAIWLGLKAGRSPREVIRSLMEAYEVPEERVEQDLRAFLALLEEQGLVSTREDAA